MGDEETVHALQHTFGVAPGTPLLLLTGAAPSELPQLCDMYQCVTKAALLQEDEVPPKLHWDKNTCRAFFDFQMAKGAAAFYGNRFSTFSTEVRNELLSVGRGDDAVRWLNRPNPQCVQQQEGQAGDRQP